MTLQWLILAFQLALFEVCLRRFPTIEAKRVAEWRELCKCLAGCIFVSLIAMAKYA